MRCSIGAAVVVASLLSPLTSDAAAAGQTGSCAVTAPNQSPLPDLVRSRAAVPAADMFRHGNSQIWTSLWPEGNVVFRKGGPGFVLPDGSLKMKFLWLMAGDGPLTLEGRRLDGEAGPLRSEMSDGFVGRGFQPSYLIFATAGCWEVTAKSNGSALTFVTKVTTEGY
jgi:hypothetical protein